MGFQFDKCSKKKLYLHTQSPEKTTLIILSVMFHAPLHRKQWTFHIFSEYGLNIALVSNSQVDKYDSPCIIMVLIPTPLKTMHKSSGTE